MVLAFRHHGTHNRPNVKNSWLGDASAVLYLGPIDRIEVRVTVKEILRARSHGTAELLKIELQANDIDAVIRGDLTLGIVGG